MTAIALILFDLHGVLYRYDRAARIARLAEVAGLTPDAVLAAIWESGFEDSGDAGALSAADYLRGFGARLGTALREADWVAAQEAAIAPMPDSLALLGRLRADVACAVLTNNNLLIRKHFAALYPEVAGRMAGRVHVSAEFGARKPDAAVYQRCAAALGVAADAVLFIDDAEANVRGAEAAGLQAWRYDGAAGLAEAFARMGLS